MSKAVLNVSQSDKMRQINEKWFGKEIIHQSWSNSDASSSSLDLSYFWCLFLIAAATAIFALILNFLLGRIHFDTTIWRRIAGSFHIFRLEDGCREGGINLEPPVMVEEASPSTDHPIESF